MALVMRTLGLISFLLCLGIYSEAQMRIIPREKIDAVNNPRLSLHSSSVKFQTSDIRAGILREDAGIKTYDYPFENIGSDTLKISRLVSTCSCATVSSDKLILAPGESSNITVRYNPKGHLGKFERKFFVYIGNDESPSAILRLLVDVQAGADLSVLYRISKGNIRMRSDAVAFQKGVRSIQRLLCVNVSNKPLSLECDKTLLPECLAFGTEPRTLQPGEEGEIVILYDPSKGGERSRMPIVIKGLGVPPSQSAIIVNMNMK